MLTVAECRKHLPPTMSDDEVLELRDLLYEFWRNMFTYLENNS